MSIFRAVGYCFEGVWALFSSTRAARLQAGGFLSVVALGIWLQFERWEWVAAAICCTVILLAEALNTAVEATVDLATPGVHPLAKMAKDLGAGAVLIAVAGGLVVAAIIVSSRIWP